MENMDYSFDNLFEKNKLIKEEDIKKINNFKKIYNMVREYEYIPFRYDDIITNSDIRIEFLIETIRIVIDNQVMDSNTRDIILQMYEELYNYFYKDSELNEIEIPEDLIRNIFSRTIIPSEMQIRLIMNLIRENKRIFNSEMKGRYFSQTLDEGLHKGITKELKIEEKNLSHLLGLTNEGSLYEFYRKTMLEEVILQILNFLNVDSLADVNLNKEEFNKIFKMKFGLEYSEENKIKIINWRYNALDEYLQKRGITVTDEEREALNQSYDFAAKSMTLDFYSKINNVELLIKENEKIRIFIFEYIRKEIINKGKLKNNLNELKKLFSKEEIELLFSTNTINDRMEGLLIKYIEYTKYKFEEDKQFKNSFINKFGYSYPLMNYYELLSKNIGFYNFSLFKNLNSIIVDYDSFGKKIESDVFLASYSQNKMSDLGELINKLINEKDSKYEKAMLGDSTDNALDNNYIMNMKSLLSFPLDERYYFNYGFISRDKQKQDDKILKENGSSVYNITLIGFKTDTDEVNRLKCLENTKRKKIKHFLNCETNITSDYYQYVTDFVRNGVEYPLDILDERSDMPYNRKRKILKIIKPFDKLRKYMTLFETCKSNMSTDFSSNIEFAKYLRQKMYKIIDDYEIMSLVNTRVMRYRLEMKNISQKDIYEYRSNIEKEMSSRNSLMEQLNKYRKYVDETINYYDDTFNHKRKI